MHLCILCMKCVSCIRHSLSENRNQKTWKWEEKQPLEKDNEKFQSIFKDTEKFKRLPNKHLSSFSQSTMKICMYVCFLANLNHFNDFILTIIRYNLYAFCCIFFPPCLINKIITFLCNVLGVFLKCWVWEKLTFHHSWFSPGKKMNEKCFLCLLAQMVLCFQSVEAGVCSLQEEEKISHSSVRCQVFLDFFLWFMAHFKIDKSCSYRLVSAHRKCAAFNLFQQGVIKRFSH